MSGDKQHHLPAALIGGFGNQTGCDPRDAVVCWRRRAWSTAKETKAESIGWRSKLYRLSKPPPGVDQDVVDTVWDGVERRLPGAVQRFEEGIDTAQDRDVVLNYAAMLGVRHPQFEVAINRWLVELGRPTVAGDHLQAARLDVLRNSLVDQVPDFRWRVLHSPPDAPRFFLSDLGWAYIGQQGRSGRGLYLPLNARVAAVAWLSPGSQGGFDHQVLRPNWVRWLNAAMWNDAPDFAVAHPDEASALAQQRHPDYIRTRYTLALGSFQGVAGIRYLFDEI